MSLSWNYLTAAAQMCITLGYHRDQPQQSEKKEARQRRIRLFWLVYMIDKMLSLRLSRPSLLRDGDITAPFPFEHYEDTVGECLNPVIPKWVKMSRLQGKVYDDIYSPGALLRPEALREARARELAAELHAVFDSRDPVEVSRLQKGSMTRRYSYKVFRTSFTKHRVTAVEISSTKLPLAQTGYLI